MTQREAFEAWWGQAPVELQPLQPRTREDTLSALRWAAWQAAQAAQPARQVPTTNYVQPVPDHCDRITWRNRYYHLPLAAELAAARAQGPVSHRYRFSHPISGEPVWRDSSTTWNGQCVQEVQPLFAAPTPPVREPLTDAEIDAIARAHGTGGWQTLADMQKFARAVEAAIKEQGK